MRHFMPGKLLCSLGLAAFVGAMALSAPAADTLKKPVGDAKGTKPSIPPATSYPEKVLASKPVGYWRLDEAKGPTAFDATKQNRDGSYHGAVAFGEPGALKQGGDRSIRFDGRTAYVELPAAKAFGQPASGKGLSVEVWMKPGLLEFAGETDDPYVFWIGKGEPGQHEWALRFYSRKSARPNRISAYIFNRAGGLGAGAYVQEPLQPVEWIHIVACFDPGDKRNAKAGVSIYKNGALRGGPASQHGALYSSFDIMPEAGTAPVRLGTRNFTSYFAGGLDEFAIYPRVLAPAEILDHYRAATRPRKTTRERLPGTIQATRP